MRSSVPQIKHINNTTAHFKHRQTSISYTEYQHLSKDDGVNMTKQYEYEILINLSRLANELLWPNVDTSRIQVWPVRHRVVPQWQICILPFKIAPMKLCKI